ncbi:MAG: TolC family protein, partial [Deltaproteobacteria bacterium]|nr:TolC family protein [Deltaproteobacteria bacterium]
MTRYVFSLFAALALMSAARVEGQGSPSSATLELSDVLRSAERHHPRIMAAVAREAIARAELLAARGGFDPELEIDARVRTGGYYELRRLDVQITQPTPLWGAEVYAGYRIGRGVEQDRYPSYYSDQTRDGGELRAGVRIPIWRDGVLDPRRARRTRAAIGVETAQERRAATLLRLRRAATDAY